MTRSIRSAIKVYHEHLLYRVRCVQRRESYKKRIFGHYEDSFQNILSFFFKYIKGLTCPSCTEMMKHVNTSLKNKNYTYTEEEKKHYRRIGNECVRCRNKYSKPCTFKQYRRYLKSSTRLGKCKT